MIEIEKTAKKTQVVTLRLPLELLAALDKLCLKGERNPLICKILQQFIEANGNQIQADPNNNYERLIQQKVAIEKKERDIRNILEKAEGPDRQMTLYQTLVRFALSLDKNLDLDNDLDLAQIRSLVLKYKMTGEEPFSASNRQDFAIYLSYVLKRRQLVKEIDKHLLNNDIDSSLGLIAT